MKLTRRDFLKILLATSAASFVDYEKLLWVPSPHVTVPKFLSYSEILSAELDRMIPRLHNLFERNDVFYAMIGRKEIIPISSRVMRVPLEIRPGHLG